MVKLDGTLWTKCSFACDRLLLLVNIWVTATCFLKQAEPANGSLGGRNTSAAAVEPSIYTILVRWGKPLSPYSSVIHFQSLAIWLERIPPWEWLELLLLSILRGLTQRKWLFPPPVARKITILHIMQISTSLRPGRPISNMWMKTLPNFFHISRTPPALH
jgi:hypothetical protein